MNTRPPVRPRWLRPAVLALVALLHVAGLAVARSVQVTVVPSLAPVIEIAPAPEPSPQPEPEQVAAVEPPPEPPEPEVEPPPPTVAEAVVPTPEPPPPPRPEKKVVERKKPVEKKPIERRPAPVDTTEARAAATAAAESARAAAASYAARVAGEFERHKRYPAEARAQRIEGTVVLAFVIGPSGAIVSHAIARSSGNAAIDGAVHAMVAASRFDPPPGGRFASSIPLRFRLTR